MLVSGLRLAFRLGIVIYLASYGIVACYSQTEPPPNLSWLEGFPKVTIRKEVQEVNLILTVTDHRRHFVRDLTPAEITIQDNGEPPQQITYFEAQTGLPLRVALVIDTSNSVLAFFDFEKQAAETFLKHTLRSASDIALVVGFNEQAWTAQGPTVDHRLLARAIKELRPGGYTAIYDAVAFANQELGRIEGGQPSRRAIILITDGEDNSSHISQEVAAEMSQQSGSIIYALDAGGTYFRDKRAEQAMKQLSDLTGGQYLLADNEERIGSAFAKIEAELRSQYALGYKPASVKPDGSFHRIFVRVPEQLRVRYRQGYFAR